ncbi:hypothetical protein U27_00084 [Candidatus Vecturithrix granuli]|uniref:PIN domain-containing protein n=1 Tax=Vecturithrix granuli TaxID=1499967 RepID=A0A081C6I8_VECG1|nr:hypothetical protein U27_00084 [Candidatus Vecturithrix granuli]
MKNMLIDTDVLIDVSRDIAQAVNCLQEIEPYTTLMISAVTHMELLVGCRNARERQELERFLLRFQVIALNDRISTCAVELLQQYRLSHGILIPDALIAATALVFDLPFLTKNQRDYRFIEGLSLLSYPCSIEDLGLLPINSNPPGTEPEPPAPVK